MTLDKKDSKLWDESIGVVVVNWNTAQLALHAIRAFVSEGVSPGRIVFVDQGSTDDSVRLVRQELRGVKVLSLPENRGYSTAVNAGARRLSEDYLIVANADVRFEQGTLKRLKETMESDERIAVVGPRLVDGNGVSATRFSRTGVIRAISLLLLPGVVRGWWRRIEQRLNNDNRPFVVSWVEGSFMLMRRSAFDELGGFDESFSFYFEDGDLAIRLKRLGYKLCHCPGAMVTHFQGSSFLQVPSRSLVEFYQNCLLFYQKHLPRKMFWLKMFLDLALHLKLFFSPRSDESSQAYRHILQVLRGEKKKVRGLMLPDAPLVSIIIPTYERVQCLLGLLKLLEYQTYQKYEIIVVDQSELTDKRKKRVFGSFGRKLQIHKTTRRSRPHAKNFGLRLAKGDLILFLDDDLEIPPNFVSTHIAAYADPTVGAVSCRVTEEGLKSSRRGQILKVTSYGQMVAGYESDITGYVHSLVGGNMSVPRNLQRRVGDFDPLYGGTSVFEEPDFSSRIRRFGYNILFTNKSTATHVPQEGGNLDLKRKNPAQYYHWFHHNEILYFLKNHSRFNLFLVIPFCMLRTVKQSLKFDLNLADALFMMKGAVDGWRTYYTIYR